MEFKKVFVKKKLAKIIKKKLINSKKIRNKDAIKKYDENYGYYAPTEVEKSSDGDTIILMKYELVAIEFILLGLSIIEIFINRKLCNKLKNMEV